MKNILKLSTGIVIIITIMLAGGCKRAAKITQIMADETTIYLKAFKIGEEMHVLMWNSYDPYTIGVDSLNYTEGSNSLFYTDVKSGSTVIWELVEGNGINEINKIGPKKPGKILKGDAEKTLNSKRFRLKIPKDLEAGEEKYDIEFKDYKGNLHIFDPYIRIPD